MAEKKTTAAGKSAGVDISEVIGDLEKQEKGVPIPWQNGIVFTIASTLNRKYRNYLQDQMARARRAHRNVADLPSDVTQDITTDAMSRHILKGWNEGALTVDGKPFEHSQANALELLKKSTAIRDFVSEEAQNGANFGIGKKEESAPIADTKSRS